MSDQAAAATTREYDVVVVGGGPAGASAGIFTARYGLETVVFDRGSSSLHRCAHLENYLAFPAGIDVETFSDLSNEQIERAGATLVSDLVESVEWTDGGDGFVVETQDGRSVTARRVVAATRYDGEYLDGLDADDAMFETRDHGGDEHRQFRRDYADDDGRTPVEDLYVASPSVASDHQAIMAAGRGARVGLAVVRDLREEAGFPAAVADHYDWLRKEVELGEEWRDRDRWREFFDERTPDDLDVDEGRRVELREAEIDRRLDSYLADDAIDRRQSIGHERLAAHLDDEAIIETVDDETILAAAREIEAGSRTEPGSGEVSD